MKSTICAATLAAVASFTLAACSEGELIEMGAVPPPIVAEAQQVEVEIAGLELQADILEEQLTSQAISDEEAEDIRDQIASLRNTIALLLLILDNLEKQLAAALPHFDPAIAAGIPRQIIERDRQSPIVATGNTIHVGANVAPEGYQSEFGPPQRVSGADVYTGVLPSEVTVAELIDYLEHDYRQSGSHFSGNVRRFGATPPTIRIGYRTDDELVDVVVRGVQIINAALPHYYQLEISDFPAFSSEPSGGEVSIEFAPRSEWVGVSGYVSPTADGFSNAWFETDNMISKGRIWIDPTRRATDEERLNAVVHEILHILGRDHPSSFLYSDTIMLPTGPGVPGHALHPLDVKALQAVYTLPAFAVPVDDLKIDYGYWRDETWHFVADFGEGVAVGLAIDNLHFMPWARGPAPDSTLTNNTALSGTVRWTGLLGGRIPYDPNADGGGGIGFIGGEASLSIAMETLTGDLDFTRLRYLADSPDGPRVRDMWGDGDLEYDILVEGNTFVQTGGDDGIVTGAFFRASHEAMGGTLERSDLIAAFGGTR